MESGEKHDIPESKSFKVLEELAVILHSGFDENAIGRINEKLDYFLDNYDLRRTDKNTQSLFDRITSDLDTRYNLEEDPKKAKLLFETQRRINEIRRDERKNEEREEAIQDDGKFVDDFKSFVGFSRRLPYNVVSGVSSRLGKFSIRFYDFVNSATALLYKQVRKLDYSTPEEEAVGNMDSFCKQVVDRARFRRDEDKKQRGIKKRLQTFGDHYITLGEVGKLGTPALEDLACEYDWKGLIPQNCETLKGFVYRGNAILFLHKTFREHGLRPEIKLDTDNWDISLEVKSYGARPIKKEDIEEASRRIPYHMDLSWVAGFIEDESGILSGAYGVCFTLPKYNGLNFLLMRERYKSREKFIDVLAHEMTHMGTVYLDTRRDFLETKSYAVGSAAFGEHTIAINQRPSIIHRALKAGVESILHVSMPETLFKILPKVQSAVSIAGNRRLYAGVRDRLHKLYGEDRGNYFLGRLTADEIEEFGYTNDVPARIEQKDSLKWRIMKRNSVKL